jgi:hypothetical protein
MLRALEEVSPLDPSHHAPPAATHSLFAWGANSSTRGLQVLPWIGISHFISFGVYHPQPYSQIDAEPPAVHEDYLSTLGPNSKGKERGGPDRERVVIDGDVLTSEAKGEEGKSNSNSNSNSKVKRDSKSNSKPHQFVFLLKSDVDIVTNCPSPAPSPPRPGQWGVVVVTAGGGEVTVRCPTLKTARSLCTLLQQNNMRVKNPELSAL